MMRNKFFTTIGSLFCLIFFTMSTSLAQYQPLYKTIPNNISTKNQEAESNNAGILIVEKVSIPSYQYFRVASDNTKKPCVIICPGGGYAILAAGHEGSDLANYFNSIGVNAIVLKYRIPNAENQIDKSIAPLQDAQQAMLLARTNADSWGIDKNKIGIMGFSAGGHLAATAATHFEKDYTGVDDGINLRPDYQILLYPVISFRPFGHSGSSLNLLGKKPSEELIHLFSNEEQITDYTPKAFMVHAADDKAVPIKNSLYYVEKLTENNVAADLHVYAKGGHGFGLNNKTTKELWFDRLAEWLKTNHIL